MDLAARQHRIGGDRTVHLFHMALDHLVDLRMTGKFLIGGIGDVVAFSPVADGGQVDVDKGGTHAAISAENHRFEDVGEEFQLVFNVFGRKERPVRHLAHILGAVDDAQMPGAFLEEPGIPRGNPAIGILGRGGRLGVLVVFHEGAGGAVEDLAAVGDLHLHAGRGNADRVRPHLAIGLLGDEDRRLRLAVELLQIDAERAVEIEDLRPDRLTRRIADADARIAQRVLQRPVDKNIAQPVAQAVHPRDRLAVKDRGTDLAGKGHVAVEHALLDASRILHADHDVGQLAFEDARRGEEIARPDLAQVGHHGRGILGAIDGKAGPEGLPDRKDEIPDPGHRQIGEDVVIVVQPVELRRILRGFDDVAVRQDHALRLARRARGVEHDAGMVIGQLGRAAVQLFLEAVMPGKPLGRNVGQGVHGGMVVFAHPALVEIGNVVDAGQAVLHLKHLVDLLLIAADHEARAAMVEDIGHLFRHRVLIERHRHRAAHFGGDHGPVKRGAVAADDGDMVAPLDPKRHEAQRDGAHLGSRLGPGPALPDAEFLFPIGGIAAPARRVARQKRRNRLRMVRRRVL